MERQFEYEITSDGNIISKNSNWRGYGERKMTKNINSYGYYHVRINVNGKRKCIPVHKLVANKYLPERPSLKHEIRHLDGNKLNNNYKNLAWGTRKENAEDREKHGRTSRGIKHSIAVKLGIIKYKQTLAKAEGK